MAMMLLQQAPTGSPFAGFIPLIAFVLIFYFLFIMPQRREQKRHREMIAALNRGDQVVTMGGLVGEIVAIKEDLVTIKSGDARVVVERARIARLLHEPASVAKS